MSDEVCRRRPQNAGSEHDIYQIGFPVVKDWMQEVVDAENHKTVSCFCLSVVLRVLELDRERGGGNKR